MDIYIYIRLCPYTYIHMQMSVLTYIHIYIYIPGDKHRMDIDARSFAEPQTYRGWKDMKVKPSV